ncbi:MAG: SpoIVB peptidase [Clostridia bacterium]|nr:SpoIVB peptidase [Clostridia bacterium]
MKKLFRTLTILLSLSLIAVYYSPSMEGLKALPDTVASWEYGDTLLLTSNLEGGAAYVRQGEDERLAEQQDLQVTVSLFGLIPLKTVTVAKQGELVNLGGQAVGVVLYTDGVQVVGLGSVSTENGLVSPASNASIKQGDTILSVNGTKVLDSAHFRQLVNSGESTYRLTILREGQTIECTVTPAYDEQAGRWVLGAWVRDSTSGVGTLSFYDEDTYRFYALGHPVTDIDTGTILNAHSGIISLAEIFDVEKGISGKAGELYGSFSQEEADVIGYIDCNTEFGIAGSIKQGEELNGQSLQLARASEVVLGEATMYSTVSGHEVLGYSCNVIRADVQSSPMTQGVIIEITDERLIERTGGIVQGISGSPVVQNGKLIGVVTHVFVNEPLRGYCLYAEWMHQMLSQDQAS